MGFSSTRTVGRWGDPGRSPGGGGPDAGDAAAPRPGRAGISGIS